MSVWDIYQFQQIKSVRLQHLSAEQDRLRRDHQVGDDIEALHERIDRLTLLLRASWDLLADGSTVTTDDLLARVAELLREEAEVAAAAGPRPCPGCDGNVAAGLDRCSYCGHQFQVEPTPFQV